MTADRPDDRSIERARTKKFSKLIRYGRKAAARHAIDHANSSGNIPRSEREWMAGEYFSRFSAISISIRRTRQMEALKTLSASCIFGVFTFTVMSWLLQLIIPTEKEGQIIFLSVLTGLAWTLIHFAYTAKVNAERQIIEVVDEDAESDDLMVTGWKYEDHIHVLPPARSKRIWIDRVT